MFGACKRVVTRRRFREREKLDLQIPRLAGKHRYIASQRVNGAISQHTRLSDVSIKHRCTPDLRYITGPVFALCARFTAGQRFPAPPLTSLWPVIRPPTTG